MHITPNSAQNSLVNWRPKAIGSVMTTPRRSFCLGAIGRSVISVLTFRSRHSLVVYALVFTLRTAYCFSVIVYNRAGQTKQVVKGVACKQSINSVFPDDPLSTSGGTKWNDDPPCVYFSALRPPIPRASSLNRSRSLGRSITINPQSVFISSVQGVYFAIGHYRYHTYFWLFFVIHVHTFVYTYSYNHKAFMQ